VWVAVSTSTDSVARRVLALIGVGDDGRFASFAGRMEHRAELEGVLADWIAARPSAEVLAAFEAAHAAAAPVYTMADLARDPHVRARGVLAEVDGVVMPGPVARLGRTPGRIRGIGRPLGSDTEEVLSETARPEEVE
jgi:crotonobetainyl-CoA:carnitine CoA-transferase CaiB-like acyl-CoA transferase